MSCVQWDDPRDPTHQAHALRLLHWVKPQRARADFNFTESSRSRMASRVSTFKGVLKLELDESRFTWAFIDVGGRALDKGSAKCRNRHD